MPRNTKAIIHLDAIKANYQLANQYAPQSKSIAVIKADAYGHGCIEVAQALETQVPAFAVAIFEEAVQLREAGITKPILILQGVNQPGELEYASNHDLWTMVENKIQANLITQTPLKAKLKAWLKLDTGMHRLGLDDSNLSDTFEQLKQCLHVDVMTLCSHLASASDVTSSMTSEQMQRFEIMTSGFSKQSALSLSIANSAALSGFPETRLDWNRPGIMLYGLSPFEHPHPSDNQLQPAMTFTSEVIGLRQLQKGETVGYGGTWQAERPSTIATITAGYADGYPRHAANGTPLSIAGQQATLAGRVSMDMITADVTDCSGIKIGDPVELWGKNINANKVAQAAETIGYDLLTGVSQRVPRDYCCN